MVIDDICASLSQLEHGPKFLEEGCHSTAQSRFAVPSTKTAPARWPSLVGFNVPSNAKNHNKGERHVTERRYRTATDGDKKRH